MKVLGWLILIVSKMRYRAAKRKVIAVWREFSVQTRNGWALFRGKQVLSIVLISPSRYDDLGFVVRNGKGLLPNNSLATIYHLVRQEQVKQTLGPGIRYVYRVYDESVQRVQPKRIAKWCRMFGTRTLVMLVGVQTNQFPRASDLALAFRKLGFPVIVGGFHDSGVLAQFPKNGEELNKQAFREQGLEVLEDEGVSLFAGEAEGRMGIILQDFWSGRLQPIYNYLGDLPNLEKEPIPLLYPYNRDRFTLHHVAPLETCRGCPFHCSYCTICVVQGRGVRPRSVENFEQAVRQSYQQGVRSFFFTSDNLSRDPFWEEKFDILITMREIEEKEIWFFMQVDSRCYKIPGFIEKAGRAGCKVGFVGLESVNPDNLDAVGKKHNRVQDYEELVAAFRTNNISIHFGYMIGLPCDTAESIAEDVEKVIALGPDQVLFSLTTPLPGSDDHREMFCKGKRMDPDLNAYDCLTRPVAEHPKMSRAELSEAFWGAWNRFYCVENIVSILKRTLGDRDYWVKLVRLFWYKDAMKVSRQCPLISGFFRKRDRESRRATFPRMSWMEFQLYRIRINLQTARQRLELLLELVEVWLQTKDREGGTRKDGLIHQWAIKRKTRSDLALYWSWLSARLAQKKFWLLLSPRTIRNALSELGLILGFLHVFLPMIKLYFVKTNDSHPWF